MQGNLILADSNYEVLTLLRSHRDDAKGFAIMARHPYPIHTIRLRQAISQDQLEAALDSADEKQTLRGRVSCDHKLIAGARSMIHSSYFAECLADLHLCG